MNEIKLKILVVDDLEANLIAMEEALEEVNAEIILAQSGAEALQQVLNHEFAVILMDVQMPEMDGFETAELMRKNKQTRATPIIFVTAISKEEKHVFKGYETGAVDYLFKPIDPHILCSKVAIFLEMYKQKHSEILKTVSELRVVKSELKVRNEELTKLALCDALTGLSNRHQFEVDLKHCIASCERHKGRKFALIFLDLDNFKAINDSLGHQFGDSLLKFIASLLSNNLRQEDNIARLGGDEFAILVSDINHYTDAGHVASMLKEKIEKPIEIEGNRIYASFSMGIACFPFGGNDSSELMRNADIAMYRSKTLGKNQISYFTEELQNEYLDRVKVENALREAVSGDQFRLVYQPIFNLESRQPLGVEALLRWQHPQLGDVSPVEFIPLADESGLIEKIGTWVIQMAFDQIQKWTDMGFDSVYYAVNLSPRQLQQSDLFDKVEKFLENYSFDASCLILEMTEAALFGYKFGAEALLKKFDKLGIRIILDDFGTGYSSLMKLRKLPIYALKIDASFIDKVGIDRSDEMITKAILSIAKNLNFISIAEGIEEERQLEFLTNSHCLYGQGFYLERPQEVDVITKLLEQHCAKPPKK